MWVYMIGKKPIWLHANQWLRNHYITNFAQESIDSFTLTYISIAVFSSSLITVRQQIRREQKALHQMRWHVSTRTFVSLMCTCVRGIALLWWILVALQRRLIWTVERTSPHWHVYEALLGLYLDEWNNDAAMFAFPDHVFWTLVTGTRLDVAFSELDLGLTANDVAAILEYINHHYQIALQRNTIFSITTIIMTALVTWTFDGSYFVMVSLNLF